MLAGLMMHLKESKSKLFIFVLPVVFVAIVCSGVMLVEDVVL